jgi:hypothetical protein
MRGRGRRTIPIEEIPEDQRPTDGKPVYDQATQDRMRVNGKLLVDLLGENFAEKKKANLHLRYLLIDSLEAISGQEHGDQLENWQFWINNPTPDAPLKPREVQ